MCKQKEFFSMSCHASHATSNHITTPMPTLNVNPKTNMTTIKCSCANKMIMTCHVRPIFIPIDQTNKKLFISCNNNLLNVTIQSHSTKQGCCKPNETCLIVATINPISHSHPVHHGTFFKVLIHKFIGTSAQRNHFLCTQSF